jgi:P pilus assembly chaperone PapD
MIMRAYYQIFLCLFYFITPSYAQITVAPSYIIINEKIPNGDMYIKNNSNSRVEVNTEVFFGYFESDTAGEKIFVVKKSGEYSQSAAGWISVYPKKFMLFPEEEKRLRIIARAPKGLPDGEYWSRIKVFTSPVNSNENRKADSININVKLDINFSFVIPAFYRKGLAKSGVCITDFIKGQNNDNLIFFIHLKREENSAYRGNIILRLRDQSGKIITEKKQETVVYYNIIEKFTCPFNDLLPGIYFAEVELNTDMKGRENVLRSSPVFKSITFEIP